MTFLKDIIAVPFGYLMELCCRIFPNYLAALAVFTVLLQILLALVFGIKQQKNSVKQALLAPKVAAIRKKYAGRNDQQTMMKMPWHLLMRWQMNLQKNWMKNCTMKKRRKKHLRKK